MIARQDAERLENTLGLVAILSVVKAACPEAKYLVMVPQVEGNTILTVVEEVGDLTNVVYGEDYEPLSLEQNEAVAAALRECVNSIVLDSDQYTPYDYCEVSDLYPDGDYYNECDFLARIDIDRALRDSATAAIPEILGVDSNNHDAIDRLAAQNWWEFTQESPELRLAVQLSRNG